VSWLDWGDNDNDGYGLALRSRGEPQMPSRQDESRLSWEPSDGTGESRAEANDRTYRVAPQSSGRAKLMITDRSGKGGPVKSSGYYASPKVAKEAAQRKATRKSG
jgi:hypothetical protein